jgi:hypothetical protein
MVLRWPIPRPPRNADGNCTPSASSWCHEANPKTGRHGGTKSSTNSSANVRCPDRATFLRNCSLSSVKMRTPRRPREMFTYCSANSVRHRFTSRPRKIGLRILADVLCSRISRSRVSRSFAVQAKKPNSGQKLSAGRRETNRGDRLGSIDAFDLQHGRSACCRRSLKAF